MATQGKCKADAKYTEKKENPVLHVSPIASQVLHLLKPHVQNGSLAESAWANSIFLKKWSRANTQHTEEGAPLTRE